MRISDWSSDVCSSDLFHASDLRLEVDRFAGALGDPGLATVLVNLVPNPRRLLRLRVDVRHIRDVKGRFLLDDTAGRHLRRGGMALHQIGRASCRESGGQYV